jgi:hypothetical protein
MLSLMGDAISEYAFMDIDVATPCFRFESKSMGSSRIRGVFYVLSQKEREDPLPKRGEGFRNRSAEALDD